MSEYVDFHYMPLEGRITGNQVLKQTEDAINDLGNKVYNLDIDESRIDEAIENSEQAINTANSALSAVTTDRAVWKNTVAEMKATDIDLGVTAATRGKNLYNDGDGAFYVVRQEKSGDIDGEDTVFLDNGNVAERLKQFDFIAKGNNIIYVENVASLREADAVIDNVYGTIGYYSVNDGGAGVYNIRPKESGDVEDGGSIIFLSNGNVAELITDGTVSVKQFGAKGDGVTEDTAAVQNAINFSQYVMFPSGTYLLRTINTTRDTKIFTEQNASIKLDYGEAGVTRPYYTVFSFTNCEFTADGLNFIGQEKTFSYGTYPYGTIFHGVDGGTLNLLSCTFDRVQQTGVPSSPTAVADRYGTIFTTLNCNINVKHCKFTNCKNGELTQANHDVATADDIDKDVVFDDIYCYGNTYSFNFFARNAVVKNIKADHTLYQGSFMNAFAFKNILIENIDVDIHPNAISNIDTTEAGLVLCENIEVRNCGKQSAAYIYGKNIVAQNAKILYCFKNWQNPALSPYTVKSDPDYMNVFAENCDVLTGESYAVTWPEHTKFVNCNLLSGYDNTVDTSTSIYHYVEGCKVTSGQFTKGSNTFINCELSLGTATAGVFGNANKTGVIPKTGEHVRFVGCWSGTSFTLYQPWSAGNNAYKLQACDGIVDPYA